MKFTRLSPRTSAQDRSKIIAYIDITLWIIFAIIFIIIVILIGVYHEQFVEFFIQDYNVDISVKRQAADIAISIGFIIAIIIGGIQLYLNILLLYGSKERNYRKINRWFTISSVLFVLTIFCCIINLYIEPTSISNLTDLIGITYRGITLWIIFEFVEELRSEQYDFPILYEAQTSQVEL